MNFYMPEPEQPHTHSMFEAALFGSRAGKAVQFAEQTAVRNRARVLENRVDIFWELREQAGGERRWGMLWSFAGGVEGLW